MKHIISFHQLNESSKFESEIKDCLDIISKKVDKVKLSKFILDNKKLFIPLRNKYFRNGSVLVDEIKKDLQMTKNEEFDYFGDYGSNINNPKILRMLYKFFVRWPKEIVKELVEMWRDSKVLTSIMVLLMAMLILIMGSIGFLIGDKMINGLDSGRVITKVFVPAHTETHHHMMTVGKSHIPYTTTVHVPDAYSVEIVGENGRKEVWRTYNLKTKCEVGDTIYNSENWVWSGTEY